VLLNDAKMDLEHEEAQWNKAQAQNDQQISQHNVWDKKTHLGKASEAVEGCDFSCDCCTDDDACN